MCVGCFGWCYLGELVGGQINWIFQIAKGAEVAFWSHSLTMVRKVRQYITRRGLVRTLTVIST
jgi:hypothetical protein